MIGWDKRPIAPWGQRPVQASCEETWMTIMPVGRRRRRADRKRAAKAEGGAVQARAKADGRAKPASRAEAAKAATAPPQRRRDRRRRSRRPPRSSMLSTDQREALEKLSLNLARAAMTAQGAIAEAALRAGRPAGGADARPVPRRAGAQRGDGPAGRPARPADARPGRPLQPLHGPLAGGRAARCRRSRGRRWSSRPRATSASPIPTGRTIRCST